MDTKQLEYFIAVAELLNFTKAAQKFYISQTAISLQIKSLETSLNCKLFIRNNRKVTLTPFGHAFYKEAKLIINQINESKKNIYSSTTRGSGILRIGLIREYNSKKVYNLINNFHLKFPDIDLTIIDDTIDNLTTMINNNILDLIFTVNFNLNEYDNFEFKILETKKFYVITSPFHEFATKKSVSRCELKNQELLALDRLIAPYGFDKMIGKCVECGFSPKIIKQCSSVETLLFNVYLNNGITIFPKIYKSNLNRKLKFIPLKGINEYVNTVIVWNPQNSNKNYELLLDLI